VDGDLRKVMQIDERCIELRLGDITQQRDVDAVVTAANAGLRGGGGVDGAIHRAAGPELLGACREIGGCPTGSAVITRAFDMEAWGVEHVVHAVGPVWSDGNSGEDEALAGAYRTSLVVADHREVRAIAFPSISTGIYGFPVERAATIALGTTKDVLATMTSLERVVFVLFDDETHDAFETAMKRMGGAKDGGPPPGP
jgi:O-acetyl-ADP-ribose deacetylase (regulator of RNase III)